MKKKFFWGLLSLLSLFFVTTCTENTDNDNIINFWVNSAKAECTAGAGLQQCLQIYRGEDLANAEWEYFYENIEGFDFEPGYLQRLEVKETPREKGKVPADASTLSYTLVRVLEKKEDERYRLSGTWLAQSVNGNELADLDATPSLQINVDKMVASGTNACNNYQGSIETLTNTELAFGMLASTKKMCPAMEVPDSYDQALNSTVSYRLQSGKLELLNSSGEVVVAFTKTE